MATTSLWAGPIAFGYRFLSFFPVPLHNIVFYLEGNAMVCFFFIDNDDRKQNKGVVLFHYASVLEDLGPVFRQTFFGGFT